MWLVLLSLENYEEMFKMASKIYKEDEVDKFISEIEKINFDDYRLTKEDVDALDKIVEIDTRKNAMKAGHEEGLKQGTRQNQIMEAKKLSSKGMNIKEIADILNLKSLFAQWT